MGNAWFVSPLTKALAGKWPIKNILDVGHDSVAPTPSQVFAALGAFPDYQVSSKRRDRGPKGDAIDISIRNSDGSWAVGISLLGVRGDDRPVEVFTFDYYKDRDELMRIVAKLPESCGPFVLWHDSGDDNAVVVTPGQ